MQTVNPYTAAIRTWKRTPVFSPSFYVCAVAVGTLLCLGAGGATAGEAAWPADDPGMGPGPYDDEPPSSSAPLPSTGSLPAAPPPPTTWRLGENLKAGDSYTYEICNSIHAAEATYPDPCYTLRMDFVHRMTHHAYGPAWVIEVGFDGKNTVMLLDYDTMTIHPTSAWDVWLAGSIQNTVLHLAPYGEQGLEVGSYWGEIDAYFYSVPLSITSRAGDKSVLGYDTAAESRTVIISGMPFPEYSRWHDPRSISEDPRIIHEYTLVR